MLAFPRSVRIFVAVEPVDMRKQYDGFNPDVGIKSVIPTSR